MKPTENSIMNWEDYRFIQFRRFTFPGLLEHISVYVDNGYGRMRIVTRPENAAYYYEQEYEEDIIWPE